RRVFDLATAASRSRNDARPRPRLGDHARSLARSRPLGLRMRAGRRHRPALYSLHVRHDRPAEGRGARQCGHLVALKWSMKNLYGVEPGEAWWAASDIGWVV